ncbi:PTS IIA-like nitrogen regulatory protein PtsN [Advenella alkanexedens]|jgi:PTS system nitrogen regulatory IIA component|uniref:PTS IIA-like nitrogen regulatory protein PtsN n=1 Tax=Advenella alkanexedens TaxID=1481665 RepID=A0ABS6NRB1_9BURK|nr:MULTISPECIES: PTS IIA-like nitrogen regulatory protein PtsN [Advenella]MBV4398100.1 PTS IIA-like nitrogen regulatory protein PtsN [Advenella alkanexedens]MDD3758419.1 PTS IIA-like nitrogen regulatory protein PtsN [Advenella sp.]NLN67067.1 PTS IIA-like nitrogen regulatory protein PtsN [Alcaligenaceae bacterium]WKU19324.1 PTS IIA-like nitrogen regulatory protein PtsN [Advenella alkanexedens]
MNLLTQILTPENTLLDVNATSKKRAFEQAALLFENNQGIARSVVFDSLFSRERLGSTALGHGVAVPHGRISKLKQATAAFMRLANPIPFDSPDGQNVQLLIILLVPESATQQHLEILAEVARILSNDTIRHQLLSENDPAKIYDLLTQSS